MVNLCVFASGNGSNFEAIANGQYRNINVKLLVCDNPNAYVIKRASKFNIPCLIVNMKDFSSKKAYEEYILSHLLEYKIDYICLAGYMKIISNVLLKAYENKIINIHPSLLPSFKGAHGILDAYNYGVKVFGVTIHYVDNGVDTGKIIDQEAFHIDNETIEEVEEKIHDIEHKLYVKVIKKLWEV